MVHPERIQLLNDRPVQDGRYVLYWMQASQRAECNHALEYAIRRANELKLPPVVLFGITDEFPEANERHYAFMLEGLAEVQQAQRHRGIQLVAWHRSPESAAAELAGGASLVVADRGYLRVQKQWREHVARKAPCSVVQVETDVIVPVEVVSDKEEFAARTIRPKIHKHLQQYLVPLKETPVGTDSLDLSFGGLDLTDMEAVLQNLDIDRSVAPVEEFTGGTSEARRLLDEFIEQRLDGYDELRNEPALDHVSHMSPYLHFGQISPLTIALEVMRRPGEGAEAYLEELIVRRELSMNFVHYNPEYDSFQGLPDWARKTLGEHADDTREVVYSPERLEAAETDDPYWNAAQTEMVARGKMHNYMRMYWGKKILEWSESPEEAFRTALYLNNKYELDGRDPNSFTGVAWCFGKHDRPWKERPIFGKVRYMNAAGLERKFDMDAYIERVEGLR